MLAVVPPVAALLIRLLGSTLRYEDRVEPGGRPGDTIPGPKVYALWHRALLVSAHRFRGMDIAILISRSFDGELIARTVKLLGFRPVRGSSSRGGASGLRQMQAAYAEGHICAITADGPRGPMYVAKPGAALLAKSVGPDGAGGGAAAGAGAGAGTGAGTGTWVGCFHAHPERRWELRSWDRFMIPKPFSRVVVTWPRHVPAEEVAPEAVQACLDRAVAMAEGQEQGTGNSQQEQGIGNRD
jgi:lysophospholipid acyltransferase (LPLAT)-like uncharacterized protein